MYTFKICKVFSVSDDTDSGMIKVRFRPEDDKIKTIKELPDCFPLLPKMYHVMPKVGEAVLVFTTELGDGASQRFYLGPIISQAHKINKDNFDSAISNLDGSILGPDVAPSKNPETEGAYPPLESIAVKGRGDCDIEINEDDLRIKCGVKISNENDREHAIFNRKNPAYMKLKYYRNISNDYSSTATIVADKINLITHNIGRFSLTDKKDLISDKAMEEIVKKAHQLPYGDILVEYLELLRTAFISHVHPYPGLPPCSTDTVLSVSAYSLPNMLCENIRIE